MSFIIEEADLEPLEPHKIREASWKELKKMSKALAINSLDYNEAFQLFRKWLDDRLLYHDQVKPMLYYTIMSNIIKHRKVLIGSSYQDPRVPVLIYMPSGSGKYIILEALFEINNTVKKVINDNIDDPIIVFEVNSKRLNYDKKQRVTDQALLGTVTRTNEGWLADLGVEGTASVVVINEASTFFNSDDSTTKNVFPYVCEALDPIGSEANVVSKKLTGRPSLKYRTETNFVLFCQPERANLNEEIITSGTLPRFNIVFSPVSELYHEEVLYFRMTHKKVTTDRDTHKLAEFFASMFGDDRDFTLTKEAEQRVLFEMRRLVQFASDDRVSGMYVKTAYQRIANMIIKMAAINCAARRDCVISDKDIRRAAIDYRATFITGMAFFTNFVSYVAQSKQRMYDLYTIIQQLWVEASPQGIIAIKDLYGKLKEDKRWNISERSIRNLLTSMEKGRFLMYDRGVGRKPGYIIDLAKFDSDGYHDWRLGRDD